MHFKRVVAAGTAFGLLAAVSTTGSAGAAAPGVGTSKASTTVLSVQLGDALGVRLLGDDARSTIDRQIADPSAFSKLVGLEVSSKMIPALNVSVPATPMESRMPGGQPVVSLSNVNLTSGIQGVGLPGSIATGTLDAVLRSSVDPLAARSGIEAAVKNLNVVGGLLSVGEVSSTLGSGAATSVSDSVRGVKVGEVSVLDLGAVLDGLGLTLADLPLSTLSGLLTQLGVPVSGLPTGTNLNSYVAALNKAIDEVQATVNTQSGTVTGTVDSAVGTLLGSLALPVPNTNSTVAQVNATVNELQETLAGTISAALEALDDLTLLKLGGVDISVATKAVDTVKGSAADITAKVGSVSVGNITVPGVDLTSAASQINGLVSQVNGTLSSVLGTISPDLANLVSVSVLDQTKSVTESGGYIRSRAGITGLTASIVPPANLSALVGTIKAATGAGEVVTGLGETVPALSTAMSSLESVLGGTLQALASGAVVKVADIQAASDFAPAGFSVPGTELPRTGGGSAPLAALALLMAALGLGIRRVQAAAVRA